MKIIFAGTGNFAVPSLEAVIDLCRTTSDYSLVGVYTQPDRLSGRMRSLLQASPVKHCAQTHQLDVFQPASLKKQAAQTSLAQLQPDLIVVADYGLILPAVVLNTPKRGCINVHASLLPRWRGAAPIQRALLEGDTSTGVTIMKMDEGLDTGGILHQVEAPILEKDTTSTLMSRLAKLGGQALVKIIPQVQDGKVAIPQVEQGACYAQKLAKQEGQIDRTLSAVDIERQIRAFNPWPISFTWLKGEKIRVWEASLRLDANNNANDLPGSIVEIKNNSICVATGDGQLELHCLQREGGRRLTVRDLLNGALSWLSVEIIFDSVQK